MNGPRTSPNQKRNLSVLIPTYNNVCKTLVEQLQVLLERAAIAYEIIVADDGSTDTATIEANRAIGALPRCRYILRSKNTGRAAIRNFLAQQAQYSFLLFIDSDMSLLSDQLMTRYLQC